MSLKHCLWLSHYLNMFIINNLKIIAYVYLYEAMPYNFL